LATPISRAAPTTSSIAGRHIWDQRDMEGGMGVMTTWSSPGWSPGWSTGSPPAATHLIGRPPQNGKDAHAACGVLPDISKRVLVRILRTIDW
jgi:hypothetical protein